MLVPSYLQVEVVTIMSKQNQEKVPVLNISEALLARSDKTFKPKEADKPKKDNVFKLTGVQGLLANEEDPGPIETISEINEEADNGSEEITSLESIDEKVDALTPGLDQELSEEKDIQILEVPQGQSENNQQNKELELQLE